VSGRQKLFERLVGLQWFQAAVSHQSRHHSQSHLDFSFVKKTFEQMGTKSKKKTKKDILTQQQQQQQYHNITGCTTESFASDYQQVTITGLTVSIVPPLSASILDSSPTRLSQ
jgi:hypothetical protein